MRPREAKYWLGSGPSAELFADVCVYKGPADVSTRPDIARTTPAKSIRAQEGAPSTVRRNGAALSCPLLFPLQQLESVMAVVFDPPVSAAVAG